MTYTYDQVVNNNGVQLYNATTKAKEDRQGAVDLRRGLRAERPAASAVGADATGPLRLVVRRRPNVNQVADGHLWSSGWTGSPCAAR